MIAVYGQCTSSLDHLFPVDLDFAMLFLDIEHPPSDDDRHDFAVDFLYQMDKRTTLCVLCGSPVHFYMAEFGNA